MYLLLTTSYYVNMNIKMEVTIGNQYHSLQQQARVITENWATLNLYCPICGAPHIEALRNNKPVADLQCSYCHSVFELKSHNGAFGSVIVDGAYETMITRLLENNNPHLFVLEYKHPEFIVENLWLIPKYFFTPQIIIKRRPLSSSARRAGWIGCNIAWKNIPLKGKIPVIRHKEVLDPRQVCANVSSTMVLADSKIISRGWLMDVLFCLESLGKKKFSLDDVYGFTKYLQERHQENHNIKAKIRQQLQLLRDKGYVKFLGNGEYIMKN